MGDSYQHEKIILELLQSSKKKKRFTPYIDLSQAGRERAWKFFFSQKHLPTINPPPHIDKIKQAHLEYQREVEAHKIMGALFTALPPQRIPKLHGWPSVEEEEEELIEEEIIAVGDNKNKTESAAQESKLEESGTEASTAGEATAEEKAEDQTPNNDEPAEPESS